MWVYIGETSIESMAEQPPNAPLGVPVMQPIPSAKRDSEYDFHRWLEQPDDIIERIERDIRGEERRADQSGKLVWVQTGEPRMNAEGIRAVVSIVRNVCNKNTFISDITEERLNTIMRSTANELNVDFFNNWRRYELKLSNYEIEIEKIINILELSLRRALNGGERKFLTNTGHTTRILQQQDKPPQGGNFLGGLMGGS